MIFLMTIGIGIDTLEIMNLELILSISWRSD